MARKIGKDHGSIQTLATGSQHLVGPAFLSFKYRDQGS
jgi:hypothetical protein